MNVRALLPVIIFVIMLIVAIVVGDWVISGIIGIPVSDAPFFLRALVHGVALGGVFYVAAKYFSTKMG